MKIRKPKMIKVKCEDCGKVYEKAAPTLNVEQLTKDLCSECWAKYDPSNYVSDKKEVSVGNDGSSKKEGTMDKVGRPKKDEKKKLFRAKMAEYTPGPWEARGVEIWETGKLGLPIGRARKTKGSRMDKANAKLMAAAPELLAVCTKALNFLRSSYQTNRDVRQRMMSDLMGAIYTAAEMCEHNK